MHQVSTTWNFIVVLCFHTTVPATAFANTKNGAMVCKSSPNRANACKAKKRKVATEEAPQKFYVATSNQQQPRVFVKFNQVTKCLSEERDGFFLSFEKMGDALAKVSELESEAEKVDFRKLTLHDDDIASVVSQKEDHLLKTQGVVEFLKEQLREKETELQACQIELCKKILELDELSKLEAGMDLAIDDLLESDLSSLSSLWTPSESEPSTEGDSSSWSPTESKSSTEAGSDTGFSTNSEDVGASIVVGV